MSNFVVKIMAEILVEVETDSADEAKRLVECYYNDTDYEFGGVTANRNTAPMFEIVEITEKKETIVD